MHAWPELRGYESLYGATGLSDCVNMVGASSIELFVGRSAKGLEKRITSASNINTDAACPPSAMEMYASVHLD